MAGGCCSELLPRHPGPATAPATSASVGRHCLYRSSPYMTPSQGPCGAVYPMLMAGGDGGAAIDRRMAAELAERRLRSVAIARDMELGLPQTLPLPDGEEFPFSSNQFHIRTFEQEREIYQACIRPPPNRTLESREISMSKLATSITSFTSGRAVNFTRADKTSQVAPPSATDRSALTVNVPSLRRSPELRQSSPKRPRRKPECEPSAIKCEATLARSESSDSRSTTPESSFITPEWSQVRSDCGSESVESLRRSPEAQQLLPFSHSETTLSGVRMLGCDGVLPVVSIPHLDRHSVAHEERNA